MKRKGSILLLLLQVFIISFVHLVTELMDIEMGAGFWLFLDFEIFVKRN